MSTATHPTYGTPTAITITLNSLANGSAQQGAAVDNSSSGFFEAHLTVTFTVGTVSGSKLVNIYLAGSVDGTAWPGEGSGNNDGVTGSNAAITLGSPTNLIKVWTENTPVSSKTYVVDPIPVSLPWNAIPMKWTVIVENQTGAAFAGSNCSAQYTGQYPTSG